jgi:hypothetical protein
MNQQRPAQAADHLDADASPNTNRHPALDHLGCGRGCPVLCQYRNVAITTRAEHASQNALIHSLAHSRGAVAWPTHKAQNQMVYA